jgi:anti-sigma factor RsiW
MNGSLRRLRFWRDHRWAPDHMSAYLDGELPASARVRMERHVRACRQCREVVGGLTMVIDGLHRLPAPTDGGGAAHIAAAVQARLGEPPQS